MIRQTEIAHSRALIERAEARLAHQKALVRARQADGALAGLGQELVDLMERGLAFKRAQHRGLLNDLIDDCVRAAPAKRRSRA